MMANGWPPHGVSVVMSAVPMVSVDYMLRHVARGDGRTAVDGEVAIDAEAAASPLTRYYTAAGYPPGRWIGSGLAGLGKGAGLAEGSEVDETAMRALFEDRTDPVTGEPILSRRPPKIPTRAERIERRVLALQAMHPELPPEERATAIEQIRDEERRTRPRHAVLGFDLTFKPPKSVSVLWAVADHGTQVQLVEAHHEALSATLRLIEEHMLGTRIGAQGVRKVRTRGLVAAAFDHWDSRAGDPLLHTHVTVANAVQADDAVWRTIDSSALLRATVAASETYNLLVADAVSRRLGLGWEMRARPGRNRQPGRELALVDQDLIDEFSGRSARIEAEVDARIEAYQAEHGRLPSQRQLHRIRQAATLATRTGKHVLSLAEATAGWRQRAARVMEIDPLGWARGLRRRPDEQPLDSPVLLTAGDLSAEDRDTVAARTVDVVASRRSTWGRWNLHAEAVRQIAQLGWQFQSPEDAWAAADAIVAAAIRISIDLTPPELASVPDAFRARDGQSQFVAPARYTTTHVLEAEDRLVAHSQDTSGPRVDLDRAVTVAERPLPGRSYALDVEDQAPAAVLIATSGRTVEVLVGPAGTGKTTTMAGLRAMWEADFGAGSVVGLAPSAQAAQVLADDLGVATDNTAQWLAQQQIQPERRQRLAELRDALAKATAAGRRGDATRARVARAIDQLDAEYRRWSLRPGQLLIVDEAGMAGTFALDKLAAQAAAAGAKLLLVGDPHQLSPVESGGALGMLVADRPDTPQLSVIRRFTDPDGSRRRWEEQASLGIRLGDPAVVDAYLDHGRVSCGERDDMVDTAYLAWQNDTAAGRMSLLIARDNNTVRELNERARTDLVTAGRVTATGVALHDGLLAGAGDRIVTREIDRYLADGSGFEAAGRSGRRTEGFVRNGQQWTVERAHEDGALTVRLLDTGTGRAVAGAASVVLPAAYVAEHVELAYASTAHRAQGMTVDTAHALADQSAGREAFYVAMTRGRLANSCYLSLDAPDDGDDHSYGPAAAEPFIDRDVFEAILANTETELSARQTIAAAQDAAGSLAQLVAEYETLARYGHDLAAGDLIAAVGVSNVDQLVHDPDFQMVAGPVRAAARAGIDAAVLAASLRPAFAGRVASLAELADAVHTLNHTESAAGPPRRRLVGELVPDATPGIGSAQVLRAMTERAALMTARVDALTAQALADSPAWLHTMTPAASDPAALDRWNAALRIVVAYRDRWQVTDPYAPLGSRLGHAAGMDQRMDQRRAARAIDAINETATAQPDTSTTPDRDPATTLTGPGIWDGPDLAAGPSRSR